MDRPKLISGLVTQGIKQYFKDNPVKDNSEKIDALTEKLDELTNYIKILSSRSAGDTVIELHD